MTFKMEEVKMYNITNVYTEGTVLMCRGKKFTIRNRRATIAHNIYGHSTVEYDVMGKTMTITIVNAEREGNLKYYPFADDTGSTFFFADEVRLSHELEGEEVVWIRALNYRHSNTIAKVTKVRHGVGENGLCAFELEVDGGKRLAHEYIDKLQAIKPVSQELLNLREKYLAAKEVFDKIEKEYSTVLGDYSLLNFKPYAEFSPNWVGLKVVRVQDDKKFIIAGTDDTQAIQLSDIETGKLSSCTLEKLVAGYTWVHNSEICGELK